MDTKRKFFLVLGSIAVIASAGVTAGTLFLSGDQRPAAAARSKTTQQSAGNSSLDTPSSPQQYRDGTYQAHTSYVVPGGNSNAITTSLTIAGGAVADVTVHDDASDRQSLAYIDWFEQDLKSHVVGATVANLSPSRIGGASLTTDAFDQTLDTIKSDASA